MVGSLKPHHQTYQTIKPIKLLNMSKFTNYKEVDFNNIVVSTPEKKSFEDPKDKSKKIEYQQCSVFYKRLTPNGMMADKWDIRLPVVKFYSFNETANALAMPLPKSDPVCLDLLDFFQKAYDGAITGLVPFQQRLGMSGLPMTASALVKPMVFQSKDDGGNVKEGVPGCVYLKFLAGGDSRQKSLFVGPNKKTYDKSKFYNMEIKGSPIIRIDNGFFGVSRSFRVYLLELDIQSVQRLNQASLDPSYVDTMNQSNPEALTMFEKEMDEADSESQDSLADFTAKSAQLAADAGLGFALSPPALPTNQMGQLTNQLGQLTFQ